MQACMFVYLLSLHMHTLNYFFCVLAVGQAPSETLWDKPDGGTDSEGHYSVLRLRHREAESPLPKHTVLQGNWLTRILNYQPCRHKHTSFHNAMV